MSSIILISLLVIVLVWIISIILTINTANKKGYNSSLFFKAAVLSGPIALQAVLLAEKYQANDTYDLIDEKNNIIKAPKLNQELNNYDFIDNEKINAEIIKPELNSELKEIPENNFDSSNNLETNSEDDLVFPLTFSPLPNRPLLGRPDTKDIVPDNPIDNNLNNNMDDNKDNNLQSLTSGDPLNMISNTTDNNLNNNLTNDIVDNPILLNNPQDNIDILKSNQSIKSEIDFNKPENQNLKESNIEDIGFIKTRKIDNSLPSRPLFNISNENAMTDNLIDSSTDNSFDEVLYGYQEKEIDLYDEQDEISTYKEASLIDKDNRLSLLKSLENAPKAQRLKYANIENKENQEKEKHKKFSLLKLKTKKTDKDNKKEDNKFKDKFNKSIDNKIENSVEKQNLILEGFKKKEKIPLHQVEIPQYPIFGICQNCETMSFPTYYGLCSNCNEPYIIERTK